MSKQDYQIYPNIFLYQRPIRAIGKSEYIVYTALMICATVHSDQGEKLWNVVSGKRKKRGSSESTDYGKYMKP